MAVMKVKESRFGAPADVYVGKFLGTQMMKEQVPPKVGRDGKPMEPGLEWQFEITEGEFSGQIVGRITGTVPTTKNAAGKLLSGLMGRTPQPDDEVDPDTFRGQMFKIIVSPSTMDPNRTQVTQIVRIGGQNGAVKPPPAAPPSAPASFAPPAAPAAPPAVPPIAPPAPPSAPKPPAQPAGVPEPKYWVASANGQVELVDGKQIREAVKSGQIQPTASVMNEDRSSGWKTVHDFGLDLPF